MNIFSISEFIKGIREIELCVSSKSGNQTALYLLQVVNNEILSTYKRELVI